MRSEKALLVLEWSNAWNYKKASAIWSRAFLRVVNGAGDGRSELARAATVRWLRTSHELLLTG